MDSRVISLLISSLVTCLHLVPGDSVPCNLSHSDNHICLHIYLERDFPLLHQMIINPTFIREGREFDDACRPMTEMKDCYQDMLDECSVYWHFVERAQILRVILAVQGVHRVLCSNRSIVLQELVRSATCLEAARREGHCDETAKVVAPIDFPKMMRFEESWEMCNPLHEYQNCLVKYSKDRHCDPIAIQYLELVMGTWNHYFCYAQLRDDVPIPAAIANHGQIIRPWWTLTSFLFHTFFTFLILRLQ